MQIAGDQLRNHLEKKLASCYFVQGDEPLLVAEAADAIRGKARQSGFTERQAFHIDNHFNWESLKGATQNLSLFGSKKLLELNIPSGKVGNEGSKVLQAIDQLLNADTIALILTPKLDQPSQSSKWVTALNENGVMVVIQSIKRDQLPSWIRSRLLAQKQEADNATLDLLADKSEGNLLAAFQEIQKLGLLYPTGKLSFEQVNKAVFDVARYDLYQLGDALISGDAARFSKILSGLKGEGEATTLILWQISDVIRTVLGVLSSLEQGENLSQALRNARVWGNRQTLLSASIKRFKKPKLLELLQNASEIDFQIKGLRDGDAWDQLRQLGLDLIPRHS
jgi:DNA polymerase-3 subunit delta